jgi:hypothetical protein
MKYDTTKIVAAIKDAAAAARFADPGRDEDGGTCNFDAAFVCAKGMRLAQIREITEASKPECLVFHSDHSLYGRILMLGGCTEGQANRRTVMAEAAGKSLKAAGIESGMYYQMD